MPPQSSLNKKTHEAILRVLLEDPILSPLSIDEICKSEPKYIGFFGEPKSNLRRLISYQRKNYKKRRNEKPRFYALACLKFGVEVDQAANPIVFDWLEILKADQDQGTEDEAAETMPQTPTPKKKYKVAGRPLKRSGDEDGDEDDAAANVGFEDEFYGEGKKNV
jgi:hypothetical protein